MKIINSILTATIIVAVLAACKKEEEKQPEPVDKFANTFLVEKIETSDFTGQPTHYEFEYDALNRITASDNVRFFYNNNGTVRRLESIHGNYIDFRHDNNNRIDRAIVYMNPVGEPDTIYLFYGSGNKPDSTYRQLFDLRQKFHYDLNGFVKRVDLYDPEFDSHTLFEYQNGNMVKMGNEHISYDFKYDDKPNAGLAMHLPAEYYLATELMFNVVDDMFITMQNNMIKETYTHDQDEPDIIDYPVLEYNEAGLPTKVKLPNSTVEYVYEER